MLLIIFIDLPFLEEVVRQQGFPFENFGGGDKIPPPHLGKSVGGENIRRFLVGGKHNFTNLMGKNT